MNPSLTEQQRDCLIAVVGSDADIRRFSEESWYRIPARAIGRSLGREALDECHTLALYQTATVTSGLPSTIELWGEIDEIRQALRREIIPDEPTHPAADDLYHLVRVRNVQRLDHPVTARRPRRITFIRTTGERLLHAVDINDLIVGSDAEEKLWNAIREFDVERKYFMRAQGMVMEVDFAIFTEGRTLAVLCGGENSYDIASSTEAWSVLRFSPGRLESEFADCLQEIMVLMRDIRTSRLL